FNINDLLEFEIILKSDEELDVAYKVVWLDEQGFELRNAIDESYKVLRLLPYRQISISKLAQDKRAKSFKIYLTTKGL
ncbi:MAG: YcfL family protein, partial [Campylobacter sp.]|uniref:YcfL family protein n=1 Tax=Campylobacter sp. TaxID=205 RepID=UPI001B584CE7